MAKVPMTRELKRLHKKFTLGNIVFMVIAVIALCAQLFMPFLDLRIHITGAKLAPVLQQSASGSSSNEEDEMMQVLTDSLEDVELEIPVNIYPMKMLKAATGSEEDVTTFMNSVIGSNGAEAFLEEMVDALAKPVLKAGMHVALNQTIENADLTEDQKQQIEEHKEDIDLIIDDLSNGSPEKIESAKGTFVDMAKDIASVQGDALSDADVADLESSFDELVEMGKNEDGTFDVTEMLKGFDASALDKNENPDQSDSTEQAPAEDTEDKGGALDSVIEMLENPGQMILDAMKEAGLNTEDLQLVFLILFLVTAGFQAFFWALFALSAFLHVFTEKKNIRTRYVRLFCVWGGLGVLLGNVGMNVLLPKLVSSASAEAGASALGVLSAFSIKFLGSGIVTGICWLVMVVFNLVYYRPIRKQVKKATKSVKNLLSMGCTIEEIEESYDEVDEDEFDEIE